MSATFPPRETFDGPLDLLLDEVRRQRIAIEDVALAPLVARYLDYMQAAAASQRPLDIDWILLAATLISWKARSLLSPPAGAPTAADPVRDEIVGLLLAHRKQAAEELDRSRLAEAGRLSRGGDPESCQPAPDEEAPDPPFTSVWDLTQQARDLARWAAQHSQQRQQWCESFPREDDVTIAAMSEYLQAQLAAGGTEIDASRLFAQQPTPLRRVSLFLAMLDMARDQQLSIRQEEQFAEIVLTLRLAG